jgi:hypothetical protein
MHELCPGLRRLRGPVASGPRPSRRRAWRPAIHPGRRTASTCLDVRAAVSKGAARAAGIPATRHFGKGCRDHLVLPPRPVGELPAIGLAVAARGWPVGHPIGSCWPRRALPTTRRHGDSRPTKKPAADASASGHGIRGTPRGARREYSRRGGHAPAGRGAGRCRPPAPQMMWSATLHCPAGPGAYRGPLEVGGPAAGAGRDGSGRLSRLGHARAAPRPRSRPP